MFLGPGSVVVALIIPNLQVFLERFHRSVLAGQWGDSDFFLGNFGAVINPAITFGHPSGRSILEIFYPVSFFQILGGLLAGFTLRIVLKFEWKALSQDSPLRQASVPSLG